MANLNISDTDKGVCNFDENFSTATRALFSENGLDQIFSIPGEAAQQSETSGEILFETGPSQNKGYIPGYASSEAGVDDAYAGALTINIRTPRDPSIPTPAITAATLTRHNEICATIRAILMTVRNPYDNISGFTYYAVKFIRPISTRHYPDFDFLQDISTLVFQVEWAIIPESWSP